MNSPAKVILLVDSDRRSRRVLEVSLRKKGYEPIGVETAREALELLQARPVDLIVSDTDLPDGDGFEFCRAVRSQADLEQVPFIFLTYSRDMADKLRGYELGVDDYIAKPVYVKEVLGRVTLLLQRREKEMLAEAEAHTVTGHLADVGLVDILQTIEDSGKTGALRIEQEGKRGTIYFENGQPIDAKAGLLFGEDAVFRLLSWGEGRFTIKYLSSIRRSQRIEATFTDLIVEGLQRLEECENVSASFASLGLVLEVDYRRLGEIADEVPDPVAEVLRLFDGRRSIQQVVEDSSIAELESLKIIRRTADQGLLRETAPLGDQDDFDDIDLTGDEALTRWLEKESAAERAAREARDRQRAEEEARLREELEKLRSLREAEEETRREAETQRLAAEERARELEEREREILDQLGEERRPAAITAEIPHMKLSLAEFLGGEREGEAPAAEGTRPTARVPDDLGLGDELAHLSAELEDEMGELGADDREEVDTYDFPAIPFAQRRGAERSAQGGEERSGSKAWKRPRTETSVPRPGALAKPSAETPERAGTRERGRRSEREAAEPPVARRPVPPEPSRPAARRAPRRPLRAEELVARRQPALERPGAGRARGPTESAALTDERLGRRGLALESVAAGHEEVTETLSLLRRERERLRELEETERHLREEEAAYLRQLSEEIRAQQERLEAERERRRQLEEQRRQLEQAERDRLAEEIEALRQMRLEQAERDRSRELEAERRRQLELQRQREQLRLAQEKRDREREQLRAAEQERERELERLSEIESQLKKERVALEGERRKLEAERERLRLAREQAEHERADLEARAEQTQRARQEAAEAAAHAATQARAHADRVRRIEENDKRLRALDQRIEAHQRRREALERTVEDSRTDELEPAPTSAGPEAPSAPPANGVTAAMPWHVEASTSSAVPAPDPTRRVGRRAGSEGAAVAAAGFPAEAATPTPLPQAGGEVRRAAAGTQPSGAIPPQPVARQVVPTRPSGEVAVAPDDAVGAAARPVEPAPAPVGTGQPMPPGAAELAAMEVAGKDTDFDEFFQRDDQDLYSALYAEEPAAGRRWLLPMAAVAGVVIAVGLALLLTADGDTTPEELPGPEETEAPEPVPEPTAEEVAAIELAASETAVQSEATALRIGAATSLDRLVHMMAWDGVDTAPAAPETPGEEETPESLEATTVVEVEAAPVEPDRGEPEEAEERAEREARDREERAEREARQREEEERAEREARDREERAEREAREEEDDARRARRAERERRERRGEDEEEVDRLDPEDALDRAREEFERGRYGEAAAAARQLLDDDSGNAAALGLLGRSLYEMGESREAIPVLRQASRANRRDTDLLLLLGSAQQDVNDVAGARESYQQYLERDPEGPLAEDIRNILEQL